MITARRITNNECDALLMCVNLFCLRSLTMTVCIQLRLFIWFFARKTIRSSLSGTLDAKYLKFLRCPTNNVSFWTPFSLNLKIILFDLLIITRSLIVLVNSFVQVNAWRVGRFHYPYHVL